MVEISSVSSAEVLAWARRVEIQRTQTAMLDRLQESKDFDGIRSQEQGQKLKKYNGETKIHTTT